MRRFRKRGDCRAISPLDSPYGRTAPPDWHSRRRIGAELAALRSEIVLWAPDVTVSLVKPADGEPFLQVLHGQYYGRVVFDAVRGVFSWEDTEDALGQADRLPEAAREVARGVGAPVRSVYRAVRNPFF